MGKSVDPRCRVCGVGHENIGHIMSACQKYRWQLYKDRHDAILGIVVNAIADKWGIKVAKPASLSTLYECTEGAMWVDTTIPTDLDLHARRPDLILYINATNTIWILDVACTWEPLIEEREREKIGKYLPLAADMGKREPWWYSTAQR